MESKSCAISELREHSKDWSKFSEIVKKDFLEPLKGKCRRCSFNRCVGKIPWRGKWQPILAFLPGKSHGQRSQVGHSQWDWKQG